MKRPRLIVFVISIIGIMVFAGSGFAHSHHDKFNPGSVYYNGPDALNPGCYHDYHPYHHNYRSYYYHHHDRHDHFDDLIALEIIRGIFSTVSNPEQNIRIVNNYSNVYNSNDGTSISDFFDLENVIVFVADSSYQFDVPDGINLLRINSSNRLTLNAETKIVMIDGNMNVDVPYGSTILVVSEVPKLSKNHKSFKYNIHPPYSTIHAYDSVRRVIVK